MKLRNSFWKKILALFMSLVLVAVFAACRNGEAAGGSSEEKKAILGPLDSFSFSLNWSFFGTSSYDSRTGRLISATTDTNPEDYVTEYHLSDEEKEQIYELLCELNPLSYPDEYDPTQMWVQPSSTIILTVRNERFEKTIHVKAIDFSCAPVDEKGEKFMTTCQTIISLLTATEEWESLPADPLLGTYE